MPAPFEVCGEERRQNLVRFGGVDEASRHHQHVGVVVQPCQAGDFLVPAKSGADALMLVQRHADAVAASADGDARIAFARFHSRSQRMRSEEHTSELQSRQYLVCRLLLEKKKKKMYN